MEFALKKAELKKAMGIDGMPNEIFKNYFQEKLLCNFFNFFLNVFIQNKWRISIIEPLSKHSAIDKIDLLQYRVYLYCLPVIRYTPILNDRLTNFLEENGLYGDEQNGFREGRSCKEHIFILTSIIRNIFSKKNMSHIQMLKKHFTILTECY